MPVLAGRGFSKTKHVKAQARDSCKHCPLYCAKAFSLWGCRKVSKRGARIGTRSSNEHFLIKVRFLTVRTNLFTHTARMTNIIIMLYNQEVAMDRRRIVIRTLYQSFERIAEDHM